MFLSFLYVIGGPSYIRLNQSTLKNKEVVDKQIQHQHTTIIDKLTEKLRKKCMRQPITSLIQQFSDQLEILFNQQRTTSLSYQDINRTKRELKLVLSIKRKLKKLPVIIRQSDKSGVIHIGYKKDYDQKVLAYQQKTQAYVELSSNPLMDTYEKVIHLLNDLRRKNQIDAWQYKKMLPNEKKMQLAYLYFMPKPHKVNVFFIELNHSLSFSLLNRKEHHYVQLFHQFMHQQLVYQEC